MPTYPRGTIVKKNGKRYVVTDKDRTFWQNADRLTLFNLQKKKPVKNTFTARELWVYGYEIAGKLSIEDLNAAMKGAGAPTKLKKAKKLTLCKGSHKPITKSTTIAEGENPIKQGTKARMKGKKVIGLKIKCSSCNRTISVIYSRRKKSFLTARHEPRTLTPVRRRRRRTR